MLISKLLIPVAAGILSFAAAEMKASKGNATETPDVLLILGCRVRGETPE